MPHHSNNRMKEVKMKKALIATALISVLGLSAAVYAQPHDGWGGKGGKGHPAEMMGERLKEKLNLTTDQQTQVDQIMADQKTRMDEIHKQMEALRTETEGKISAILTPEQATTFKQMIEKRNQRMEDRRQKMEQNQATKPAPADQQQAPAN